MEKTPAEPSERQKSILNLLRKFPEAGYRTLAKRLHDDNPLLFPSVEKARYWIRYYSGAAGDGNRKKRPSIRPPRKPGELPPLPKSEAVPWEPFVLECKRCLVLSDIHLPYQDNQALESAFLYGDSFQPDTVLINGDLFDFHQISRFDRDPTKPKILHELQCGKALFAHLRARYPKCRIVYKLGNHDERWNVYLWQHAPLLFEIEDLRNAWHGPAGIVEHGIEVVGDQRPIMLGNLMVLHGHEKGRGVSSPVNPARGAFLRLLASVLEGHGHRQSEHSERTADGKEIVCRTTGALCGLWPEYARINKWSSGFATVEVESSGEYHVELKRIIEGKCY